MRRLVGAALAWGVILSSPAMANDDGDNCHEPAVRVAFPGVPIGAELPAIRRWIPTLGPCGEWGCGYMDRHGYSNSIADGFLFRKDAYRAQAPWLPFAVQWSDGPADVKRKLLKLGVKALPGRKPDRVPDPDPAIQLEGCFAEPRTGSAFRIEFHFSPSDGKLAYVLQATDWP